ncbi:serine hydrolase [Luteimonas sp. A277]
MNHNHWEKPMFRSSRLFTGLLAGTLIAVSGAVSATDDAALGDILDRRVLGDSSGACIAAAVIEGDRVARAWRCADPADAGRIGPDVAFEIGSVTKSMAGILLADLVLSGGASLDDPLADHLPDGTVVPEYEGQKILLRQVVTHTSGLPRLPSRLEFTDPGDPYASFEPEALLASLQDVILEQAPGETFEYSNFGTMLLSLVLSRTAGMDFEQLLDDKLFTPLRMQHAYVADRPEGLQVAAGHMPNGQETPLWTFAAELAGVGGVRATLDDMVRYARAQLGGAPGSLGEAIRLAQQPIETGADQAMAMNWLLMPIGERLVHAHDGGTGGFSSMVAFDLERDRAVVVLADTGLAAMGGVNDVAGHLLDESIPLSQPRRPVERPAVAPSLSPEQLRDYAGTYALMPGFDLMVREHEGVLHAQATGQGEFPLDAVDDDVFGATAYDIEIRFSRNASGEVVKLDLHQGGHVLSGQKQ